MEGQKEGLPLIQGAGRAWRHPPLISAPGSQRQVDLCGFKASLVYMVCSRLARMHSETFYHEGLVPGSLTKVLCKHEDPSLIPEHV